MTALILACLISLSLHGFLLSQWPAPMVRVPLWHASDTLEVTYLAPAPPPEPVVTRVVWQGDPRRDGRSGTGPKSDGPGIPRVVRPDRQLHRPSGHGVPHRGTSIRRATRKERTLGEARRAGEPGWPSSAATIDHAGIDRAVPAGPPEREQAGAAPQTLTPDLLTPDDFAQFRYRQLVRGWLQRTIAYPTGHGAVQGTVRLRLTIARDGRVASATCLQPDAPLFEEAAMAGVTAAVPFPRFPPEVLSPTLTFEFRIAFTPGAEPFISLLGGSP